jgi:hypothetical protein
MLFDLLPNLKQNGDAKQNGDVIQLLSIVRLSDCPRKQKTRIPFRYPAPRGVIASDRRECGNPAVAWIASSLYSSQ